MQDGNLVVEGCAGTTLLLTDTGGRALRTLQPADGRVLYPLSLAPGTYILSGEGEKGRIALKFAID